MHLATIVLLNGDGAHVWTGTLTQFARDNSRDLAREIVAQFRCSLDVHARLEPAFIGGGASPHFTVLLAD